MFSSLNKIQKITYYTLQTLLSIGFLAAAYSKVTADPQAVAGFATAHLPLWFMYFIGYAEIAGAIGLWIPRLSRYAAYGLWIILAGAVVTIIIFVSASMTIMPITFAIILGIIFWLGRKKGQIQNTPTVSQI